MKTLLIISLYCVFVSSAQATNLLEAYHDALLNDPQLASAKAMKDAGQEKAIQGKSGLLPKVTLIAESRKNDEQTILNGIPLDLNYNSNRWGIQLTQPLYRAQNWSSFKLGELQSKLTDIQYAQANQELMVRVSEAYFNALLTQENIQVTEKQLQVTAQQFDLAHTGYQAGIVSITDTYEAQARLDLLKAQLIEVKNQHELAMQILQQITGKPLGELSRLNPAVQLRPPRLDQQSDAPNAPLFAWIQATESGNLGVQAQSVGLEISRREVERTKASNYPNLDLVATRGISNRPMVMFDRSESTTIGLQLNMPIYTGGFNGSSVREALALETKAEADVLVARQRAIVQTRQNFSSVMTGLAKSQALQAAEISSRSALDSNSFAYSVGMRINIDVLNAQAQLSETQLQLGQVRLQTLISQLKLKASAGRIEENDLIEINSLLIPNP